MLHNMEIFNPHLKSARAFAHIMDNQFSVLGYRFGLDSLIGIIPGAGDVLTMLLSAYLIWIAFQMKLPANKIWQMVYNILIDTVIGTVPVVGDIADLIFKANIKNLQILEEFDKEIIDGEVTLD